MKILIITLEYPPQIGGIASYVHNLAAHLSPEDTIVWAPKLAGDSVFDAQNAWKTYRGKPYYAFFWPRWLRWYRQVKKIVKQEKVGLILVQHALPGGYVAYMLKKMLKIPYRVFFHGSDLEIGLNKKKKKLRVICRAADKVIVSSQFLKNKLQARIDDLNNVVVVHPAPGDHFLSQVSAEEVSRVRRQLALEGKKVIISVGRLAEGKGFPHLIRLMPKILKNIPTAALLLIGDGPKKKILLDKINSEGLQNVVRYLGFIDNAELPKYYSASDVFVLLTHKDEKSEEGWGTVYMEAAACGIPVVAGNVGGVEEAVENLVTGVLVDAYQDVQVVGSISDILHEKEYAKKMGLAGRERVEREFTWDKQVKLIIG